MHRLLLLALLGSSLLLAVACGGIPPVERVVIVTFDTTRADRIGCYGYEDAETPSLDAFAEESVLFENAISQVPTTLPSHSTMFTGLYPHDHGVRYNIVFRLGSDAVTLAERLKARDWSTAAFPATLILSKKFGLDQGFDTYLEPPAKGKGDARHPVLVMRPAEEQVDLALDWLDEHPDEKSFVWVHFYDPHGPYSPPFPYSAKYRDRPYDGELAYTDKHFGRLIEGLKADRKWDRTLVIVAGDHGEGLHDHNERYHAYLLYETTQHVPMIVRAPGTSGTREAEPVVLADITPTVLDLVGIEVPENLRGVTLRPALEGDALPARELYFESMAGSLNYGWQELRGVRSGRWKLIDSASDPELYDLQTDPLEKTNLAELEKDRLGELREALAALQASLQEGDLAEDAQDAVMDPETAALLASLGYTGGGAGGSAEDAAHPRELVDMEGEMLNAQVAVAAGEWERVEDLGRYVVGRDPKNKWALKMLVQALVEQGRADEAEHFGGDLIKYYADQDFGYIAMATALQAGEKYSEARRILMRGRELLPTSEALAFFSTVAGMDAGVPVCRDEIAETITAFPSSSKILVLRARCEAESSDNAAALATLNRAAELGFRQVAVLVDAPEFAGLVDDPGFQQLLKQEEAAKAAATDAPG
ncbi:MAG: sulfatase-like hydrolase/transferase [bacterium]|nr:sulfatase-like hydrolase/transferase [bacterium]